MSSNGNKSVRFANGEADTVTSVSRDVRQQAPRVRSGLDSTRGGAARSSAAAAAVSLSDEQRPLKKRKVKDDHMNADELDDVDDWEAENDDNDASGIIPREQELLRAKRERRTKRTLDQGDNPDYGHDDNDVSRDSDTRIDNRTSLASDGIQVEPFHMDNERTDGSGYFDGDTYVFRKSAGPDGSDEPDAWLEGLDEDTDGDTHRTTTVMADQKRADERREQKARADDDRMDHWSETELYTKILLYMTQDETVMQALVRYGNVFRGKKGRDVAPSSDSQHAQTSFNQLTEASNALLLKGKVDIYQMKRAAIEALVPTQPPAIAVANNVQWEYRGNQDGAVHGLYSTKEMLGWIQAGYFVGATAVQVRSVQAQEPTRQPEPSMQDDLLSDLMDDEDTATSTAAVIARDPIRGDWILSDLVDFQKFS